MASRGPVERPQKMFQASLRQASRWPVVGVLALLALVLGFVGWAQYFDARPEGVARRDAADALRHIFRPEASTRDAANVG